MTARNKNVNTVEIQKRLRELKLKGMADMVEAMAEDGTLSQLSALTVMDKATIEETQRRSSRRTDKLLSKADLYYKDASIDGLLTNDPRRKLNLPALDALLTCDFVSNRQPVWILGASGTGKTYISCVLGKQACSLQYSAKYYTTTDFLLECREAAETKTLRNYLDEQCKKNIIILDDFLLTGITFAEATYLFEFLNTRQDPKRPRTVIITSQLKEEEMRLRLSDVSPALSESIMGRLKERHLELIITGTTMRE